MPPSEGGNKVFKIEELFQSANGNFDIQKIHLNGKGEAVISSGESNNGVVGKTDIPAKVFSANTITVDMFGNAYYQLQPYKMVTHARVFSLSPIGEMRMSEKIGLYVVAKFRYFKQLFSYNNMCSWEKIRQLTIEMPLNKYGAIDFSYIEERVRELEAERVRELEAYLQAAGFSDCSLILAEREALKSLQGGVIRSKLVRIDKLFSIATGRDIIIGRTREGNVPLISHQHDNNGISKRIGQISDRRLFNYETTIPLADRGVFLATTQAENFHIGTRVKALTFLDGKQSENVRLYFVTAINKLQILFTEYLTNATNNLPNLEISVPIDDKGAIDYGFMETYISAVKKQVIGRLKEFIEREKAAYLKATQQVYENQAEQEDVKITLIHPDYQPGRIPLYTLQAACGYFDDGQEPEEEGWIDASGLGFTPDPKHHFAVHAKGDSMLPKIKDGDICIFEWYNAGSRNSEIVLSQSREYDSEYGGKYTIKRYHSEKTVTEEGWQHSKVELQPLNPDFDTIELDEFGEYKTIGIFKCVL